jgi:NADPH:quinone reductase-like Zn-dependent oxidoreductase
MVIAAAARKFPRHLFVLEAGDEGSDLHTLSPAPAVSDNVLIVTSADKDGTLTPSANRGAAIVDLAVPAPDGQDWASAALSPFQSNTAVARIAAVAMRLRAVAPDASAGDLKGGSWLLLPRRLPVHL